MSPAWCISRPVPTRAGQERGAKGGVVLAGLAAAGGGSPLRPALVLCGDTHRIVGLVVTVDQVLMPRFGADDQQAPQGRHRALEADVRRVPGFRTRAVALSDSGFPEGGVNYLVLLDFLSICAKICLHMHINC